MSPQHQKLDKHFRKKGSITNLEAIFLYKIMALPKRISEMRGKGYNISQIRKRDTGGTAYVRYFIELTPRTSEN